MIGSWKQYNILFAKSVQKESIPLLVIGFFGRGPRMVTSLSRLALICWKEDVSRGCRLIYFIICVFSQKLVSLPVTVRLGEERFLLWTTKKRGFLLLVNAPSTERRNKSWSTTLSTAP